MRGFHASTSGLQARPRDAEVKSCEQVAQDQVASEQVAPRLANVTHLLEMRNCVDPLPWRSFTERDVQNRQCCRSFSLPPFSVHTAQKAETGSDLLVRTMAQAPHRHPDLHGARGHHVSAASTAVDVGWSTCSCGLVLAVPIAAGGPRGTGTVATGASVLTSSRQRRSAGGALDAGRGDTVFKAGNRMYC